MKVDRKKLLELLSLAKPALSKKEIVEQTVHFIFTGEDIAAFNDELAITVPYVTDFSTSVKGEELYKILSSIKEDEVDLSVEDNQMRISSKKTKAGLSTLVGEKERVTDLIERLKQVTKGKKFWKKLPEDFIEGIYLCMFSASKDMTTKVKCCIAVKDDLIYSTDNLRISKFVMSDVVDEMLIPVRDAMELVKYDVTNYGFSDGWIHFQTKDNVMFNCRTMEGEYPYASINRFFKEPTKEITVPEELEEVMKAAAIVAEGDVDVAKMVEVHIEEGKITVRSEDKGRKWMTKEIEIEGFEGDKITFFTNPIFFAQVLKKSTKLWLIQNDEYPDKCCFNSENFYHVLALPA
jgi:DNA polymerase III sliding clamp (beta) subunit (PCNA family)